MDLIITHDTSDFDAFSSMVAASKLYPGATLALGRRLSTPVRDFLALHKDRFATIRIDRVDARAVKRLIVVDVRRMDRLRGVGELLRRVREEDPSLQVHVYDHHAASSDDLPATLEVVQPVGATVTLLIEELRRREIDVDGTEATLFALGIYADTGSFMHATTTGRDLRAAAWLMDRGASLGVMNRYLEPRLGSAQRRLLSRLLGTIRVETIGGAEIGFAKVALEKAPDGLAEITSEAIGLEPLAALVAIFEIGGKKVQVVARSKRPYVDVGALLGALGGGGHPGAASAQRKGIGMDEAERILLEALRLDPPRPRKVAEIMSSPVRTVRADLPLRQLDECLVTWRHTGAPVLRDGKLAGIVSRRDIERARRDGRLDHPVSSCMSQQVQTTTAEEPLERALEQMTARDVGRLPVLHEGRLVGILTRTDALAALYGSAPLKGAEGEPPR